MVSNFKFTNQTNQTFLNIRLYIITRPAARSIITVPAKVIRSGRGAGVAESGVIFRRADNLRWRKAVRRDHLEAQYC